MSSPPALHRSSSLGSATPSAAQAAPPAPAAPAVAETASQPQGPPPIVAEDAAPAAEASSAVGEKRAAAEHASASGSSKKQCSAAPAKSKAKGVFSKEAFKHIYLSKILIEESGLVPKSPDMHEYAAKAAELATVTVHGAQMPIIQVDVNDLEVSGLHAALHLRYSTGEPFVSPKALVLDANLLESASFRDKFCLGTTELVDFKRGTKTYKFRIPDPDALLEKVDFAFRDLIPCELLFLKYNPYFTLEVNDKGQKKLKFKSPFNEIVPDHDEWVPAEDLGDYFKSYVLNLPQGKDCSRYGDCMLGFKQQEFVRCLYAYYGKQAPEVENVAFTQKEKAHFAPQFNTSHRAENDPSAKDENGNTIYKCPKEPGIEFNRGVYPTAVDDKSVSGLAVIHTKYFGEKVHVRVSAEDRYFGRPIGPELLRDETKGKKLLVLGSDILEYIDQHYVEECRDNWDTMKHEMRMRHAIFREGRDAETDKLVLYWQWRREKMQAAAEPKIIQDKVPPDTKVKPFKFPANPNDIHAWYDLLMKAKDAEDISSKAVAWYEEMMNEAVKRIANNEFAFRM